MNALREIAHSHQEELVALRRELHRHPEPSMQEYWTTDRIAQELDKLGVPYRRLNPTGLIAEIKGAHPGKTVALRSDIDALSVLESTGLDFTSENEGFMHACGHDGHITVGVGAAMVLNEVKEQIHGSVRIIFQPAEEIGEGAKLVIEQGGLDGVSAIFGMHNMPQLPAGCLVGCQGASFAAADQFKVTIKGRSSHGAMPHAGVDASVCACAMVMNLQTMVSREFSPMDPLVVTVGTIQSGSRWNICSGSAVLEGTIRSFSREVWAALPAVFERIVRCTAETYRAEVEIEFNRITDVLVNDDTMYDVAWEAAGKVVTSPDLRFTQGPQMGGEDFASYTSKAPAAFFLYGVGGEYPWHSDHYTADESALEVGAAMYAQVALDALDKYNR